MKAIITFLLLNCFLQAQSQTVDEASALYNQKKYEQALDMSYKMLKNERTAAFANQLIGRILVDQGKYDSSVQYLEQAINLDEDSSYITSWSIAYLGQVHIMTGQKEIGTEELKKVIELNITASSVAYAKQVLNNMNKPQGSKTKTPKTSNH